MARQARAAVTKTASLRKIREALEDILGDDEQRNQLDDRSKYALARILVELDDDYQVIVNDEVIVERV